MTTLDSILKSRDITDKGLYNQSYGFSNSHIWVWELDYKDKHWRIDAFELWCWERLLRVPWTTWRSNQSILKEINPKDSLEGLLLKPKLQHFGHPMQRTDSLEKTLMLQKKLKAGRERDDREWGGRMTPLTQWTWVWVNSGGGWWTGQPAVLQSLGHKVSDVTEWLNWTEPICHHWVSPRHCGATHFKLLFPKYVAFRYSTWTNVTVDAYD